MITVLGYSATAVFVLLWAARLTGCFSRADMALDCRRSKGAGASESQWSREALDNQPHYPVHGMVVDIRPPPPPRRYKPHTS